ncbi:MAG: sulfatase-like hydrolase/transferase [Paludibacter sp.]|nr:sulfatase-like hydrolase/transferase [Paludibacter sp.]
MEIKNFGIATLALAALFPKISFGQDKRPNVLIIMTDQQRWDAMRCAGNLEISTPNMDRIAKEGVQFTNAYSACPVSVPARTSILTGRTIFNNKVLTNNDSESDSVAKLQTFDMILSANGYRTEYYGKYHSPYQFATMYNNPVYPTNKTKSSTLPSKVEGLRQYLDELGVPVTKPIGNELIDNMSLRTYTPLAIDLYYGEKNDESEVNVKGKPKKKGGQGDSFGIIQSGDNASLAAFEGSEGLKALQNMKPGQPFSMTCSFGPPHPPFIVPKKYADMYDAQKLSVSPSINDDLINAPYKMSPNSTDARFKNPEMNKEMKMVYYAMISQVDEWVGKLLDELDRKGIAKNTIVLFVSDHGELLGDHGLVSKNKMYEGSARIPLLIRYPGVIPAGKKVETPVSHHDIFATILDYTGMKAPENDGRSLRKLIDGKKDSVDYAVSVWGAINNGGPFMIRKGDWKMIVYLQMDDKKQRNTNALYNLKNDPFEMNNLIGSNPDKSKYETNVSDLKQTLKDWMIKTKTPYVKELENTKL